MSSSKSLAANYSEQMQHHPHGYAIYEPVSSTDLRPGSCGFFDDSGSWTTIAQLDDPESLQKAGFEAPPALEEARDKITRSWHPKCSSGVSAVDLDLGIGVPETLELPASVQAALKYSSSSDFGAILMTDSPVERKAYLYKSPFASWVGANSSRLLQKYETEIKEHGLWLIRWTYSTRKASINAWAGTEKNVVVGFQVSTMGTDFGPKGEWHKGQADSSWDDYVPKEAGDKLVVFAGVLRYRYSKHFWAEAQLKEGGGKKKGTTRSGHVTGGAIPLDGVNGEDALVCEEIGAGSESDEDDD